MPRTEFFGKGLPASLGGCRTEPMTVIRGPNRLAVVCRLTDKGRSIPAEHIQVRNALGEGAFGKVFEGWLTVPDGRERVILKRVKDRVDGAIEMGGMEHLINVYASRTAKSSIASFMGYCNVQPHEAEHALVEGLWLMWEYEGSRTLAHYLRKKDCIEHLAADLDVPYESAVPIVMKQIFECLAGLHDAGLVHRDVKPLNIIFAEEERRFKLIDLGACADLRSGTNYNPDESILDATYCPPEQYCMPTDSPAIAGQAKPFQLAISPLLWQKNKPDRFDSYSCGLVLLQLALPKLRTVSSLKSFNQQFRKAGYNLQTWLKRQDLSAAETAILDADDGIGWNLAGALLRPRGIQVDDRGGVSFVNTGGAIRLPVKAGLRHRFVVNGQERAAAYASEPGLRRQNSNGRGLQRSPTSSRSSLQGGPGTSEAQGFFGNAMKFWTSAQDQLKSLESQLSNQESAVISQTGKVKALTESIQRGAAVEKDLQRQQSLLAKMTNRLNTLQQEFDSTAANARKAFGFLQPTQNLSNQVVAVTRKQQLVEQLRQQKGASRNELVRQEKLLEKMQTRLGTLEKEVNTKVSTAQRIFSLFGQRPAVKAAAAVSQPRHEQPSSGLWGIFGGGKRNSEDWQSGQSGTAGQKSRSGSTTTSNRSSDQDPSSTKQRRFMFFAKQKEEPSRTDVRHKQEREEEVGPSSSGQSFGATATNAAVTGLYAGLKLTGFALRVATDLATSVTKEAERNRIRSTALKAEKRKRKEGISQFLSMMNESMPPITSQSRWKDVSRRFMKDSRFSALSESVRVSIFNQYINELAGSEKAAEEAGLALFKEIVRTVPLSRGDLLDSIEEQISADSRFEDLPDGLDLEAAFAEVLQEREPEFAFVDLLAECNNPPLTRASTWNQARKQIMSDPRYQLLMDVDRRKLFREFIFSLKQSISDEPQPTSQAPTHKAEAGGLIASATDMIEASKESLMNLTALRAEQARLRAEYEKMEAKLQAMERRMREGKAEKDGDTPALNGKSGLGFLKRRE